MALRLFDREGRPIVLSPRTRRLMPRRFRNPGGRGTCEVVYDDDGNVLHVDADSSVPEVRQAVNFVPGLYRLEQCDEDGDEIDGAPPGYLSIDAPRNALTPAITDPLAMCGLLAQTNADVSKTFADKAAGMMDALVECVRVVGGIPPKRLLANATLEAKSAPDDDEDDDQNDERNDHDDEAPAPEPAPPAGMMAMFTPAIEAMAPEIGKEIGAKVVELVISFLKQRTPAAAPASTATPASAPAQEPAPSGVDAGGAAAGSAADAPPRPNPRPAAAPPPKAPPAEPPPEPPPEPPVSTPESSPSSASSSASLPSDPPSPPASMVPLARVAIPSRAVSPGPTSLVSTPRNASPTLTPEQLGHYMAIRAALTPREVALVHGVIRKLNERGDHARREELIAQLMSKTVEQAVKFIREFIRESEDGAAMGKG